MSRLPLGYRMVGGVSIGYAVVSTTFQMLGYGAGYWDLPAFTAHREWLKLLTFASSSGLLAIGGFLLLSSFSSRQRWAGFPLLLAAMLLAIQATNAIAALTRDPGDLSSKWGGPVIILPASVWAMTILLTTVLLEQRHRRVTHG